MKFYTRGLVVTAGVIVAALVLSGCAPTTDDVKAACEARVSRAVIGEWSLTQADRAGSVEKVKSASMSTEEQSDAEVSAFVVLGTAVLHEGSVDAKAIKVSWTCRSRFRHGDKRVAATITDVALHGVDSLSQ